MAVNVLRLGFRQEVFSGRLSGKYMCILRSDELKEGEIGIYIYSIGKSKRST